MGAPTPGLNLLFRLSGPDGYMGGDANIAPERDSWRYYFAGQALPALLAMNRTALAETRRVLGVSAGPLTPERIAVLVADATLAALEAEFAAPSGPLDTDGEGQR